MSSQLCAFRRILLSLGILSLINTSVLASEAVRSPDRVAYLQGRLLELEGGVSSEGMSSVAAGSSLGSDTGEVAEVPASAPNEANAEAGVVEVVLPTGWKNAGAWERIEVGMSTSEVTEILGRPEKVLSSLKSGVDQIYYYEK